MKNEIYLGDCIEGMKSLPDKSVNTCVTSPPYYGLRDYGNDGQIGLEETPEAFVQKLVEVFREVKRVLRDDGTLWLNLGDSYARNPAKVGKGHPKIGKQATNNGSLNKYQSPIPIGLKEKDLIGIPWRVAFALQADGWYLRQDIIWHKPNPMPESVTDRCTKAHEYIFLLSKSPRYYFDSEAMKEEAETNGKRPSLESRYLKGEPKRHGLAGAAAVGAGGFGVDENGKRNKRSVWTVTTKPFKDAHFATYPEDLIVPCIKAGCPIGGIVLDPFMGAGTTALVSRKLDRNYVGFELNPEYRKIALNRIESVCGPLKY